MASHPCPETFQLVRTLRQVSPHGDSFTPSDWPVTGHSPGRSDLWRAFTLPEYSTRTKKEYCRLPLSANAFILAIGRYTAVSQPLSEKGTGAFGSDPATTPGQLRATTNGTFPRFCHVVFPSAR